MRLMLRARRLAAASILSTRGYGGPVFPAFPAAGPPTLVKASMALEFKQNKSMSRGLRGDWLTNLGGLALPIAPVFGPRFRASRAASRLRRAAGGPAQRAARSARRGK